MIVRFYYLPHLGVYTVGVAGLPVKQLTSVSGGSTPSAPTFCNVPDILYIWGMTLDTTQLNDLNVYQSSLNFIVSVLNGQSAITEIDRLVTPENIAKANEVIEHLLDRIDEIINPTIES